MYTNTGLLKRAIWNTGVIESMRLQTGGFSDTLVDIELKDGCTVFGSHFWESEALREVARQIYDYETQKLLKVGRKEKTKRRASTTIAIKK